MCEFAGSVYVLQCVPSTVVVGRDQILEVGLVLIKSERGGGKGREQIYGLTRANCVCFVGAL